MKIHEYQVKATYDITLEPQNIANWFREASTDDIQSALNLIGGQGFQNATCNRLSKVVCQDSKNFWKRVVSAMDKE